MGQGDWRKVPGEFSKSFHFSSVKFHLGSLSRGSERSSGLGKPGTIQSLGGASSSRYTQQWRFRIFWTQFLRQLEDKKYNKLKKVSKLRFVQMEEAISWGLIWKMNKLELSEYRSFKSRLCKKMTWVDKTSERLMISWHPAMSSRLWGNKPQGKNKSYQLQKMSALPLEKTGEPLGKHGWGNKGLAGRAPRQRLIPSWPTTLCVCITPGWYFLEKLEWSKILCLAVVQFYH